jgi:hypothetical protein
MIVCLPILFVMLIKIIKEKKFVSFQNFLGFVPILQNNTSLYTCSSDENEP